MDNLTHSLFGLTLARTPLGRAGRGATAALLLASNAPDVDIIVTAGGAANYLEFHRGPTHGPLGVIGLGCVVAALVSALNRRVRREHAEPTASFLMLWAVAIVGIVGHVLMDLPTSYGTRPLSPFSWTWYGVDWMPIVDICLLAILGGGFWFSRGTGSASERAARRSRTAVIALVLMIADYGMRGVAHEVAIARAPEVFGPRLPDWCEQSVRPGLRVDHWPRFPEKAPREVAASRCLVEVAAVPDFLSPFSWRLIAHLSNGYEIGDVNLLARRGDDTSRLATRTLPVHVPNQWTPAVVAASAAPTARVFLGFSRFPAARSLVAEDGTATVSWSDLRFLQRPLDDPRQFRRGLFGATVVLAPDGSILTHRLGP